MLKFSFMFFCGIFSFYSSFAQNVNNNSNITVITHGYQNEFNTSIDYWLEFAAAIKKRAGSGSTIYINNLSTGAWEIADLPQNIVEKYGTNGNGIPENERIFLYNWSDLSNGLIYFDGHLESAADHLFALLNSLETNSISLFESNSKIHFIGHSRGVILNLQVLHRVKKYFPNKQIEQFTSLDPHPSNFYDDLNSSDAKFSLPCVGGTSSIGLESFHIKLPNNVLKADNYYRTDGSYEFGFDFDGVPNLSIENSFNRKLSNEVILSAEDVSFAHIGIHNWYLETIDTSRATLSNSWFSLGVDGNNLVSESPKFKEKRSNTGYYYSRIGGGLSQLPNLNSITESLESMNQRVLNRTEKNIEPDSGIFNGNLQFNASAGWALTALNYQSNVPNVVSGKLFLSNVSNSITHNFLFFPKNVKNLTFEYNQTLAPNGQIIFITFFNLNGTTANELQVNLPNGNLSKKIEIPIPNELLGKTGTFRIRLGFFEGNPTLSKIKLTNNLESWSPTLTLLTNIQDCQENYYPTLTLSLDSKRLNNNPIEYILFKDGVPTAEHGFLWQNLFYFNISENGKYKIKLKTIGTQQEVFTNEININVKLISGPEVIGSREELFGQSFNLKVLNIQNPTWIGLYGSINFFSNQKNVLIPNNNSNFTHIRISGLNQYGCQVSGDLVLSAKYSPNFPPKSPPVITQTSTNNTCGSTVRISTSHTLSKYLWRTRYENGIVTYHETSTNYIDIGIGYNSFISLGTYNADSSRLQFIPSNEIFLLRKPPEWESYIKNKSIEGVSGKPLTLECDSVFDINNNLIPIKWIGPNGQLYFGNKSIIDSVEICNHGNYKIETTSGLYCLKNEPFKFHLKLSVIDFNLKLSEHVDYKVCKNLPLTINCELKSPICQFVPVYLKGFYIQHSYQNGNFPESPHENLIGYGQNKGILLLNFNIDPGIYKVRLVYSDSLSNYSFFSQPSNYTITVIENKPLVISSTEGTILCPGESTILKIQNSNRSAFWYKDNTYISNSNQINVQQEGVYYAFESVSNNGISCNNSSNKLDIKYSSLPQPELSIPSEIFEGDTLILRAKMENAMTYQWTGPVNFNKSSRIVEIPNVSILNSGQYTLQIQDFCSRSFTSIFNITVQSNNNCESIKSGIWSDKTNWSCGHIPGLLDQVVINSGHKIEINSSGSWNCKTLETKPGGILIIQKGVFKTNIK